MNSSQLKIHIMTITKQIRQVTKRFFPCCPVNREYSWKKNPDRKEANSTLQHIRTDFQSMMGEECLYALSLVYIHRNTFLDYNKIIDIYASRHLNSLSENETVETFNARTAYKAYVKFRIFYLFFIVVICRKFCFTSNS